MVVPSVTGTSPWGSQWTPWGTQHDTRRTPDSTSAWNVDAAVDLTSLLHDKERATPQPSRRVRALTLGVCICATVSPARTSRFGSLSSLAYRATSGGLGSCHRGEHAKNPILCRALGSAGDHHHAALSALLGRLLHHSSR